MEEKKKDKFAHMLGNIFVFVLFICLSIISVAFTLKLLTFMF